MSLQRNNGQRGKSAEIAFTKLLNDNQIPARRIKRESYFTSLPDIEILQDKKAAVDTKSMTKCAHWTKFYEEVHDNYVKNGDYAYAVMPFRVKSANRFLVTITDTLFFDLYRAYLSQQPGIQSADTTALLDKAFSQLKIDLDNAFQKAIKAVF